MRNKLNELLLKIIKKLHSLLLSQGFWIDSPGTLSCPFRVLSELALTCIYYIVSLLLIWVDSVSGFTLLLNMLCVVRFLLKASLKGSLYDSEVDNMIQNASLSSQEMYYIKEFTNAYKKACIRETVCIICIFSNLLIIPFTKELFVVTIIIRLATTVALVVSGFEDFLFDAEDLFNAHPPFPKL